MNAFSMAIMYNEYRKFDKSSSAEYPKVAKNFFCFAFSSEHKILCCLILYNACQVSTHTETTKLLRLDVMYDKRTLRPQTITLLKPEINLCFYFVCPFFVILCTNLSVLISSGHQTDEFY